MTNTEYPMFNCKKLILTLIALLVISTPLIAQKASIEFTSHPDEYVLYNSNNQKMYYYYLLEPNHMMNFTIENADSLKIYSRIFYDSDLPSISYEYKVSVGAITDTIRKTCRKSAVTRGVDGQIISTYNKSIFQLSDQASISIKNSSDIPIVFKLDYNAPNNFSSQVEYIAYSPDVYGDEKIILLDEKEYTYYEPEDGIIELDLEGPIYLKIMSRVIFKMTGTKKIDYQFEVFDNGNIVSAFNEVGHKSSKSILTNNIELIPSTGDVHILHFEKGKHHIEIKKTSNNHSVIFRFYINKKAVFVGDR